MLCYVLLFFGVYVLDCSNLKEESLIWVKL